MFNLILTVIGAAAGFSVYYFFIHKSNFFDLDKRKKEAENQMDKSKEEATKLVNETSQYVQKLKNQLEEEVQFKKERFSKMEEALNNKEQNVQKREERNNEVKLRLASLNEELQLVEDKIKQGHGLQIEKLKEKSGLNPETAREDIIKNTILSCEAENEERLYKMEENVKENADKTAKKVIVNIIQRLCSATSVETRAVLVAVPEDYIKGKIVGMDAVNILKFEQILDVDIVFNDLPNTISISAFNMVNRRVAQKAIEKLVRYKGEIFEETVERAIQDAEKETNEELYNIGKKASEAMGFQFKDKDLLTIIGRLQYRTSYGQNIMKHSMEVGWVAAMIGAEIGLDEKVCKVAGFLHDIGKAIDQDPTVQDAHDYLTKEIMEKHGFSWEEVHAAWTHHDAEPQQTPEALIIKAADAVSAGRPGARQESIHKYSERIQALEESGRSFAGVKNAFAISAGRELRVIVDPERVNDLRTHELAKSIAQKVENEIIYPGKIKVNVIRRTKFIEYAGQK